MLKEQPTERMVFINDIPQEHYKDSEDNIFRIVLPLTCKRKLSKTTYDTYLCIIDDFYFFVTDTPINSALYAASVARRNKAKIVSVAEYSHTEVDVNKNRFLFYKRIWIKEYNSEGCPRTNLDYKVPISEMITLTKQKASH
jgi:hypothetical protein